jgi:cephalosporin hydroxylase
MSVSEVEIAHRIQQYGLEKPVLGRVVESRLARQSYRLAQTALRTYQDIAGPRGRFEWESTEQLADEAIRRGAMQKHSELAGLLNILKEKPPKNSLEIGAGRGGMIFAIAHITLASARIMSVDLPGGDFGGGYTERGKKRIESYVHPAQELELIQADSHDPNTHAQVVDWLEDEPLDFLMIDGDHSRRGVQMDWEMYGPLVGEGGTVAFHDIAPHEADPMCQVSGFWEEIRADYKTQEIIEPPAADGAGQWGGIGIVYL